MKRRPWNEREVVITLALYYQVPFGSIDEKNPAVVELARVLHRTPGAIALKLANLASLDPTVLASGRHGMANASSLDRKVFAEFSNDWLRLASELSDSVVEILDRHSRRVQAVDIVRAAETSPAPEMQTTENVGTVIQRRGQSFFRNATLAAYRSRCCVTMLPVRELLRASHIIPWATNISSRLDPRNGLCLNALFDSAFDRGLMTLDEHYKVVFSRTLHESVTRHLWTTWFTPYEGRAIELPERLIPHAEALLFHREQVFIESRFG